MNARAALALLKKPLFLSAMLAAGGMSGCHSVDDRPPAWEYISPAIFQPNCATASCHGPAAAVSGLDFSDPDRGYTSLTDLWVWIVDPLGTVEGGCKKLEGNVVCPRKSRPFVIPFDPSQSRLVNMLRAHSAPRMPPDRPLPEADIRLVETWILNGAYKTWGGPVNSDAATDRAATDGGTGGDALAADGPAPDSVDAATNDGGPGSDAAGPGTDGPDGAAASDASSEAAGDSGAGTDGLAVERPTDAVVTGISTGVQSPSNHQASDHQE